MIAGEIATKSTISPLSPNMPAPYIVQLSALYPVIFLNFAYLPCLKPSNGPMLHA